jgi:hypothetical protein
MVKFEILNVEWFVDGSLLTSEKSPVQQSCRAVAATNLGEG